MTERDLTIERMLYAAYCDMCGKPIDTSRWFRVHGTTIICPDCDTEGSNVVPSDDEMPS